MLCAAANKSFEACASRGGRFGPPLTSIVESGSTGESRRMTSSMRDCSAAV